MNAVKNAADTIVLEGFAPGRRSCRVLSPWIVSFLAIFYGLVLSQVPNEQFKDFANYLIYAENGLIIFLERLNGGALSFLVNEPVWLLVNAGLGSVLEPEMVVRTIIFFSASSVAWLVLSSRPQYFFWLILFLFLPAVVKNHLIHLRQGLAVSIFLWGWFSDRWHLRWLLMVVSPLIHASFFFVLAVLFLAKILRYLRLSSDIRTFVFVVFGLSIGLGLGFVAVFFGARQAQEYEFAAAEVSGFGFGLWCFLLLVWLSGGRQFLHAHVFETGMIIVYLCTYWLVEVTARIFESGLLLVLLGSLALPPNQRRVFTFTTIILGGFMWLARTGSSALGFGIGG